MKVQFRYGGPDSFLLRREVLGQPIGEFHRDQIGSSGGADTCDWIVRLPGNLLFDRAGLDLIRRALTTCDHAKVQLYLQVSEPVFRDYYSLGTHDRKKGIHLGVQAWRTDAQRESPWSELKVKLPYQQWQISYPESLHHDSSNDIPLALLIPYETDMDLLFANQIALTSHLNRTVRLKPWRWIPRLFRYRRGYSFQKRVMLGYRKIHPKSEIHPTAVIEGSTIEAGAQIGAGSVVRFSHIGKNVKIFDGAKVELSVVGDSSWLMHDLVLYRSYTEKNVFLIHGPYQFSAFQSGAAAFATIMMDYRPDGKPISVLFSQGKRLYLGRFLGALLKEGARSMGGVLLAPGSIVPVNTIIGVDRSLIQKSVDLPTSV